MRLWTFHPKYLDTQGLLAVWREALLAQSVLLGRTRGYRRHPQLLRFQNQPDPPAAVAAYLEAVLSEALRRGYRFDAGKIVSARAHAQIPATEGQILYEWRRLKHRLGKRSPAWLARLEGIQRPDPHPLFHIVPGGVQDWEKSTTEVNMRIEINNFSMAYDAAGRGLNLLLIHGYPLNRKIWRPQLEGLADVARVIAPDLRGHGESEVTPGPYWMDRMADDLASFLTALGANERVVICGLSMGGYIAMSFYRQYQPRVAGLILAATRAGADSPQARQNRDQAVELAQEKGHRAVEEITESMLPKLLSPQTRQDRPELVDDVRLIMLSTPAETIIADSIGMRERPDSFTTLEEIDLPVLIVHGADDQVIPVKEAEAMRDAIGNARLEILPGAGHLLNLEQPGLFNAAVRDYLAFLQASLKDQTPGL